MNWIKIIFLIIPLISYASDVEISRLRIRYNYANTIYLDITNDSSETEYIIGVELPDYPKLNPSIKKTVVDQGVVKIISINKLSLPAKSVVSFKPKGIFIVTEEKKINLSKIKNLKVAFYFSNNIKKTFNLNIVD